MRLTRITVYTPAAVLNYVAAAYGAMLDAEPATGEDERGAYITVTDTAGFTIELRPVEPGVGAPTVTRLEFHGADAADAAERLHDDTGGVQRHLFGGRWDSIAGNSVRLTGDGDEPDPRSGSASARRSNVVSWSRSLSG